ncbi:MAG: 6-hydroxymethylpterin diphosphokinase MptE-like protein [Halobacteriota archaeon]
MKFETWEPVYESILADFGFCRAADEAARDVAASMAEPFDHDRLSWLDGATVGIAGGAPGLESEVDRLDTVDATIAASIAADVVLDSGYEVDLMVTDLDKNADTAIDLTRNGVPVAAHAHGDNIPTVRSWFPRADRSNVLATTQAAPVSAVYNFGGFTDGDRAAFLADAFGAAELTFVGWEFDDPTVDEMKARKLEWAKRLLHWVEGRRDDRFDVLDGVREQVDPIRVDP